MFWTERDNDRTESNCVLASHVASRHGGPLTGVNECSALAHAASQF